MRVSRTIALVLWLAACGSEEPSFHTAPAALSASDESEALSVNPSGELAAVADRPLDWDPAETTPAIRIVPSDMTTATFGTLPTISIPARELTEREIAAFSSAFELVTWPEREVVATRASYFDESVSPGETSRLLLTPEQPLSDRWYAVRGRAPDGFAPSSNITRDRDGTLASRFRVGRAPGIERALVEPFRAGGGVVAVLFSERVRPSSLAAVRIRVDGSIVETRDATGSMGARDTPEGIGSAQWFVDDLRPGAVVEILELGSVLSTIGDLRVSAPDGGEPTIELTVTSPEAERAADAAVSRAASAFGLLPAEP